MGSGRHRRNGFEAKISNENLYTVLLHFSNEDLLGSDQIKPNSLHIVDTANLGLSLKTQKKPRNGRNGRNGQNFKGENVVKFTLYQLMEESDIKPEAAIAMESQNFIINEDFENKIIFDASEIVQSWFMDETSNQGKVSLHGVVSFCYFVHGSACTKTDLFLYHLGLYNLSSKF